MLKFHTAAAVAALSVAACAQGARAQVFQEYESQWDLKMIGVQAAYDRGYTGSGVVVGVADSGINLVHRDLVGNLTGVSLDIYTGGPVTGDPDGHGTHVAGTIAGARNGFGMQGVAYDAKLTILRLLDEAGAGNGPDNAEAVLLNFGLDAGVRIFNNSWGNEAAYPQVTPEALADLYGREKITAYQRAVDLGAIMVWATGNESTLQPGFQSGLPSYFPAWQGSWLAVTAVGSDRLIASYANHCGLAAQWCLAAPGGDAPLPGESLIDALIWSAENTTTGGLKGEGGTSMAAPHVTGAVAIARQMFPDAPAAGITRLVLTTATDLGAPGVDSVYGWGLLNVANMAATLDPQAGSVFVNGAWAADVGQRPLHEALDDRLASRPAGGGWASVLAGRARHDDTDSSLSSEAQTFGAVAGYDLERSGLLFGAALSMSDTTAEEAGVSNSATIRSVGVSAYAAARRGWLFAEATGGVDMRDYDFRRREILGTAGAALARQGLTGEAEADGLGAFARGRVGVSFQSGPLEVRPFIHGRAAHQRIDGFEEVGADVFSQTADETELTVYEAGPGVELAMAPRPIGAALVGGSLSLRYDARWGDDDFAIQTRMLGAAIPAAVGDLDDALSVSARANARLGGLDVDARGWWSEGGDHDAVGLGLGVRLSF